MPEPADRPQFASPLTPTNRDLDTDRDTDLEHTLHHIAQLGQTGQLAQAILHCQKLAQQHPHAARVWDMLGLITLQQGHPQIALSHLERAIDLDPNRSEFYDHAGVVQCRLGNFQAGIAHYQHALALTPTALNTRYNLGLALCKLDRRTEALHTFLSLIAQHPQHAMAHYQVGNLYQHQHCFATAIAHYQQAIQQQPQYAEAWCNLGVAYQQIGEIQPAFNAYQQALTLKPHYVEALNGLGTLLEKLGQATAAITHYGQALALQPNYIPALMNLGNIQIRLDQLAEAEATYCRALHLDPQNSLAIDSLIKIQLLRCHWSELSDRTAQLKTIAQTRLQQKLPCQITPLNSLFLPFSAEEQQAIAQSHAQTIAQKMGDSQQPSRLTQPRPAALRSPNSRRSKIRLGYVSGDFRCHAVGQLILRLFERHDRTQFEVFAYSLGPDDGGPERQKLAADCDSFRDIHNFTPLESARQIQQDQIDILIDLAGYTDYACPEIFALRPAPIQVNYLGYPGTLGADYMDYIIVDPIVAPPDVATHFTERCLYLPESYQLNSYTDDLANPPPPTQATVKQAQSWKTQSEAAFTFCCFNKSQKIEPEIFAAWMRILAQVPDSVLWLLSDRPEAEANLRATAQAQGIHPDRLIFAPRLPKAEHLARHAQADLFLDTLYYNAHVTASDSLWSGVPVITVLGKTFASRVAASLLTAVGLPELVTSCLEDYERLAVHLATHPKALHLLKHKLAQNRLQSPLFKTDRTIRHLETGYRLLWQQYQSGQPPDAIWVPQEPDTKAQPQNPLDNQKTVLPHSAPVRTPFSLSSPSPETTLTCTIDSGFPHWLSQVAGSLVLTAAQAGKVILVGWNGQQVTILPRQFDRPMSIAVAGDRLALATQQEVISFANASVLAHRYLEDQPGQYDALYLPHATHFTGALQIHDLAYGDEGLWLVNTRFSCLAQLSLEFSFIPRWHPPFITALTPDDRCHLNGLAMVAGKPKYVTAFGKTDTPCGWQPTRTTGGILLDIDTGEILLQGLSMPHAPRWHQGKLWLLNSGTRELWQIDPATQQHEVVCALPGFGRGLCLVEDYAIVGLSQIREHAAAIPAPHPFDRLRCGVVVVDLQQGKPIGQLEFSSGCHELHSIAFLPGLVHPTLLSPSKGTTQQAMTTPEFAYWLR